MNTLRHRSDHCEPSLVTVVALYASLAACHNCSCSVPVAVLLGFLSVTAVSLLLPVYLSHSNHSVSHSSTFFNDRIRLFDAAKQPQTSFPAATGLTLGVALLPLVFLAQVTASSATSENTQLLFLLSLVCSSLSLCEIILSLVGTQRSWTYVALAALLHVLATGVGRSGVESLLCALTGIYYLSLIAYIPTVFPRSFSLAELIIVSSATAIAAAFATFLTGSKLVPSISNEKLSFSPLSISCLFVALAAFLVPPIWHAMNQCLSRLLPSSRRVLPYLAILLIIFGLCYPWLSLAISQPAEQFLVSFLLQSNSANLLIVAHWLVGVSVGVYLLDPKHGPIQHSSVSLIIVRKYYHLLILYLMFVPSIVNGQLCLLAYCAAFTLFQLVEAIKLLQICEPLNVLASEYMTQLIDERDNGRIVLTHTYLLVGCASTLALSQLVVNHTGNESHNRSDSITASVSGLLVLGLGDSFASVVGKSYGAHRWPLRNNSRSLEGTAAMIAILALCVSLIMAFTNSAWDWSQFLRYCVSCVCVSLLEAWTQQIDNLVLPLFFYACLLLAQRNTGSE